MTTQIGFQGNPPQVGIGSVNPESSKYLRLYKTEEYRRVSNGEGCVSLFLKNVKAKPGATVIDFGCGTGRAGRKLRDLGGLNVTMIDFVKNCLDDDVRAALGEDLKFFTHDLEKPIPHTAEYGFCFPAGTVISGDNETIENLDVDQFVLNSDGHRQPITATFQSSYSGEIIYLSTNCLPPIAMTADHQVLVASVRRAHRATARLGRRSVYEWVASDPYWKAAKNLDANDWVIVPRLRETKEMTVNFVVGPGKGGKKNQVNAPLDRGLSWLLGLYVAEGHTTRDGKICLSLAEHEDDICDKAQKEFGRISVSSGKLSPVSVQRQHGLRVVAYSIGLAQLLDSWCGRGAGNKVVPEAIFLASEDNIRAFIDGVRIGDGCLRNGLYSISTVSKRLAFGLFDLFAKLKIHAALTMAEARSGGNIRGRAIVSNYPTYTITWSRRSWERTLDKSSRIPYGRAKFIGQHMYLRVRSVEKRSVQGLPVFNLGTGDHTYAVPFTVHNCADVMEHIPEPRVQQVLRNILMSARHVFFEISTIEDKGRELIGGEPLHLTVHDYRWWCHQMALADCVIHWSAEAFSHCFFYVSAWRKSDEVKESAVINNEVEEIVSHIRYNCAQGWKQVEPHLPNPGAEVMILGGGPSLNQFEDEIKEKRADGVKLVTLNGSYGWALARGLVPSATIIMDSREFNFRFVDPVVNDCKYLISSGCHPKVFEHLPKDRTFIWHAICHEVGTEILNEIYGEGGWYSVPGGSTALLRSIPLLRMLGYKRFHLYGCDSCLINKEHHAYGQPENDAYRVIPVYLRPSPKVFYCHGWMICQAHEFVDLIRIIGDEVEIAIYGDGLLAHILNTQAELATSEYDAMKNIVEGANGR